LAFEPEIGRRYEIFPDILRHHELGEGGGAVLADVPSTATPSLPAVQKLLLESESLKEAFQQKEAQLAAKQAEEAKKAQAPAAPTADEKALRDMMGYSP
jgi:hypothetical protein